MSKRDTDTEIWSEDWFLNLSDIEMLFWNYIKDRCDHAGFWRPNFKIFETITGRRVNQREFIKKVNTEKQRLLVLENGRWFLTGFISFQYCGKLNLNNRFHKSVYETFRKNIPLENTITYDFEVNQTSSRPLIEVNKEQEIKNEELGIRKEILKIEDPLWVTSFPEYIKISEPEWDRLIQDWEFIAILKEQNPKTLIRKSMEKSWETYWGEETEKKGWKNKVAAYKKAKKEAIKDKVENFEYRINWRLTIQNTISLSRVPVIGAMYDDELEYIRRMQERQQ